MSISLERTVTAAAPGLRAKPLASHVAGARLFVALMTRRGVGFSMAGLFALLVSACAADFSLEHASRTKQHVMALASDATEGRATGSAGEARAADYIIAELKRIGAQPLPGTSDYRLPFEFAAGARDGGSSVEVNAGRPTRFSSRADVQALSFSDDANVTGPSVFAGYGIVVPPNQELAYDSYAGLDVKDKIVVVLRYFPENADRSRRSLLARYSDLRFKATAARQRGAKALLVVTGPQSPNAGTVVPMAFDSAVAGSGIPAVSIGANVAEALFAASPRSLGDAQRALDAGEVQPGWELPGVTASVTASVVREKRAAANVVAYLPATGHADGEKPWIALGAHYDHLGRGEVGNSLAGKDANRHIHFGADDNASGVAAVLSIAEKLASQPRRRHVLFAFWSGEEIGLLGSAAFVRAAPVAISRIAAYLNFDMVGRMQSNRLIVQATGTSPVWPEILRGANTDAGFELILQASPYQPTDMASFDQANVATLNFFTGAHADYHRPSDTADKINYRDLERLVAFGAAITERVGSLEKPPAFVRVEEQAPSRGRARAGVRVFTGTIPDYATDAKGLLVGGVIGGAPADKAGLQKGDVIVEIAGQSIANIYDYTYAIDTLKVGEPAKVVYVRQGVRKETLLTPVVRDAKPQP